MVYIGTDELGVAGPAVYAFRASDGSLLWKQAMKHSADACLLVANGVVYAVVFHARALLWLFSWLRSVQ